MVTAQMRGHTVYYDPESGNWFYADTHELAVRDRPCIKCNAMPTLEGYDACLGHIPHATSACCGHGVRSRISYGIGVNGRLSGCGGGQMSWLATLCIGSLISLPVFIGHWWRYGVDD